MAQEWAQHVGRAIRARRKELGIGPTAFSQEMHASLKTIERWERGDTDGALRQLDEIAKVLKTTPAELVAMAPATDEEIERETPDLSLNDADRLDRIERKLDDLQEKVDRGLAALRALSAAIGPAEKFAQEFEALRQGIASLTGATEHTPASPRKTGPSSEGPHAKSS